MALVLSCQKQHSLPQGRQFLESAPSRGQGKAGKIFQQTNIAELHLPDGARPATVIPSPPTGNAFFQSYSTQGIKPADTPAPPSSLQEAVEALDEPSKWAVSSIRLGQPTGTQHGGNIAAAIMRGDCRAVCDGSYREGHGTAAFVIWGDNSNKTIRGENVTPGAREEQCAYRSEMGGVAGILTMLELVCKQFALQDGHVTIGLDCESAIKRLTNTTPPQAHDSHYDLALDCHKRIAALPCKVTFRWIQGHQDDKNIGHLRALDWWANQNISMDQRAKAFWKQTRQCTPPNQRFKHETFAVLLAGQKLSSFRKDWVHDRTNQKPIRDYWQDKHAITDTQWDDINWEATQKASKEQNVGQRRWNAKFATSHCATGKMMKIRKQWTHNNCPRCGAQCEDTKHVIKCAEGRETWDTSLAKLQTWMTETDTCPVLAKHIISLLQNWVEDKPSPSIPPAGTKKQAALLAQAQLGAWNTLLGRISRQMTERQHARYILKKSRRTGFRWTVALIKKLQGIAWDMWEHRNGILHNEPSRHHTKGDLAEADAAIAAEWAIGDQGLLAQDRFLFRHKEEVQNKTLQNKWEWLTAVITAREAAKADAAARDTYAPERRAIRNWLLDRSKRVRDDPQTTENTQQQQQPETTENNTENTETTNNSNRNNRKRNASSQTQGLQQRPKRTRRPKKRRRKR